MNGSISAQLAGRLAPLIAVVREGRYLTFRCAYCGRPHWHGAHSSLCAPGCPCELHRDYDRAGPCICPPGSGDGHRAAHCTGRSPYRRTGYVLREVAR